MGLAEVVFRPIPYWAKDLQDRLLDHNARAEEIESKPAESSSVQYWASPLEGRLCAGQEVALVGAGIR